MAREPKKKTPRQLAEDALDLMTADGDWPSPAYEASPQARRGLAMQEAIKSLAGAVVALADDVDALRGERGK